MQVDTGKVYTVERRPFLVDFLWKNKTNRIWWIAGLAAFLLQFIIFKSHYPYANYMPDSYSYIEAAAHNADVNIWPVAYSKLLRLISLFIRSDTIVVGVQYFFLQSCSLLFIFTLLYFQTAGNKIRTILLLFILLNPIPLYVANYISADAVFIGLSLLWLTCLVWIIYNPRQWMIFVHALILLACFTVRYNAIYYPVVSLTGFALCRQNWSYKLIGFLSGALLLVFSFLYTSHKMLIVSGKRQFSAFGGWQIANNALYMYEHIPSNDRVAVPARFEKLEIMVREHMDTLSKVKYTHDDSLNSHFYLWSDKGPLVQYMSRDYKVDSTTPYFNKWAAEGPLFADYGLCLIRKYPLAFAEDFMWPNAIKFIVPPTEFLATYNMGEDSVGALAKEWFNYKTLKVNDHIKKGSKITISEWYPIFGALVNCVFILGIFGIVFLGLIRWKEYGLPQLLGLVFVLWLSNCCFSIFASPIVLRYQLFPILVAFSIGVMLIGMILETPANDESQSGRLVHG